MQIARWALIGAALLAAFQAWLWADQESWPAFAAAAALTLGLIAVAYLPKTRYAIAVNRVWALPRRPEESERRYRLRFAIAWLLVVTVFTLAAVAIRHYDLLDRDTIPLFSVGLRVFGFVALMMALQSFLVGVFRRTHAR